MNFEFQNGVVQILKFFVYVQVSQRMPLKFQLITYCNVLYIIILNKNGSSLMCFHPFFVNCCKVARLNIVITPKMDSFSPLIIFGLITPSKFGFRNYKTTTNNHDIKLLQSFSTTICITLAFLTIAFRIYRDLNCKSNIKTNMLGRCLML